MLKLYFMRHAEASDEAANDAARPLTRRGQKRTQNAAHVLGKLGVNPSYIYASPRLRAQETAAIVAGILGKGVETRSECDFDFSVVAVQNMITGFEYGTEVLFVGHNPSMSNVVSTLSGANVGMKKGAIARIDLMPPNMQGELVWLVTPKVFDVIQEDAIQE